MKAETTALMRLQFLAIIFLAFIPISGYSQESGSCAENLKTAQSLFDRGKVDLVSSTISECLKSGFTREESLTAYKLIIQSYLFEEKQELADSTMLAFLKKNPEYQLSPTDHSSFVRLFNTFKVKPVVQLSFHIGTNIPFLTGIDPKYVSGTPNESTYKAEFPDFYFSLEAKFELNKKMEVNIETAYSMLKFTNSEQIIEPDKGTTTYTETQQRIEIPVSITYNIKSFGKFTPYGRLGFGPALLLGSKAAVDFNPTDLNNTPRTGPDLNRDASRISVDMFAQAGAGVKYKTRGGYFFTELRSNIGIFNQVVRADNIPEVGELAGFYSYADDDFRLNAVNFTLGYTQIFYKPSKRK
jgi:hypothetical protein